MKKILSLILVALLPLVASAETVEINGIYYNFDSGAKTAEVTSNPNDYYRGAVNIPASVTYEGMEFSVTSIGYGAFEYCRGLTSVTIPNSVTSIHYYAFEDCSSLTSIIIPNSVISIGYGAFYGCSGLTSITIPKNLTNIDEGAFGGCSGLASIKVENGNTTYDSRNNCNAIIKTTTNRLIAGCKNTTIPNNVSSIGYYAFRDCQSLISVTIPNSVTSIGYCAFYGCKSLTSVVIPESVTSIGGWAFWYTGLASITIPNNVTSIGENVFGACDYLESIKVEIGCVQYDSRENCNAIIETATNTLIAGCRNTVIPNSVTSIGNYAFSSCSGLTSITIPNGVTSIGNDAFNWCDDLISINIPNSVTSIGSYAFYGCESLSSIIIGNGMRSIRNNAFTYCSELEDVYCYAENVPETESDAFEDSPIASAVLYVPEDSKDLYKATLPWSDFRMIVSIGEEIDKNAYINGIYYNFWGNEAEVTYKDYYNNENAYYGNVVIPESVTYKGKTYMVTSIGNDAFYDCNGLTSITIPNSVKSISYNAFCFCVGLTSVIIPNSVTTIDDDAFYCCSSLTSIAIPNSVANIGLEAFGGCDNLTSIKVETGNSTYDSRNNCNAIIETATNTLVVGCKNTIIPESVTSIGRCAFRVCYGLTSINIPESVTTIDDRAFKYCYNLTSVTIGNHVTSIGDEAFYGCGLTDVFCYAKNVPETNSNAFEDSPIASATLNVPKGSIGMYKATLPWSKFGTIVPLEENYINGIYYDFSGNYAEVTNGNYAYSGAVVIPASVTYKGKTYPVTGIGHDAFKGCDGLTSVTIPNSVTSIGNYAFEGCKSLQEIILPEGLTTIGAYAFNGSGLKEMTLPSTLTSIGDYALASYVIRCQFATPFSVGTLHSNASNAILYVPQGSEQLFRNASGWKDFIIMSEKGDAFAEWVDGQLIVNLMYPGVLRLTLIELDDEEITRLKIRGPLNVDDIKYLIEGKGKIANLESLDLSEVSLIYGGDYYKKKSDTGDIGFVYYVHYYYLAEEEDLITGLSLGLSTTYTYKHYGPNLAFAFEGVPYKHIVMPKSIKKAATSVFLKCKNLQSVEFPGGLHGIEESAFYGCEQLDHINLEYADSIPYSTFGGCKALRKVEHLENVKYIGESAFYGCSQLACDNGTLALPHVASIPEGAFYQCTSLKKVQLPKVVSIGDRAFAECKMLEEVSYPTSLQEVYYNSFANTPWISELPIENDIKYMEHVALKYEGGNSNVPATLSFREGTRVIAGRFLESINYSYRKNVTALSLPSSLKHIGGYAFSDSYLTTLTLPENIQTIGEQAFYRSSMTKVTIPENLKKMGEGAFNSSNLNIVNFNAKEVQGGRYAFSGCSSLERVNVGGSVCLLPPDVFEGCENLTIVKFAERMNGTPLTIGDGAFSYCNNLISLSLPSDTRVIGDYAFCYCSSLTDFTIPNYVTRIANGVFSGCSGLTSVTIPNNVTSIGDEAFKECGGLTYIAIPHSVTYIGKEAFEGCYNLISIDVPNRVTNIGESAFYSCEGLTSVNITDLSAWCNIKFEGDGANPLLYAHHLYLNGKEIKVLTIPNDVASVGNYAFYGCEGLNSVNIPESVTSIGDYAFRECSRLTSVTIPNSVATIGQYAFYGCESLTDVYCYGTEPPIIAYYYSEYSDRYYYNSFDTSYIKYVTLHVPEESIYLYKEVEPWKYFGTIVALTDNDPKPDPDAIEDVKVEDVTEMDYFDLNGRKLNAPQKGINIIRYSDGTTRKVAIK